MPRTLQKREHENIVSLPAFMEELFALRETYGNRKFWYRGHTQAPDYKLVASIGRPREYAGNVAVLSVEQEILLLHRFREDTAGNRSVLLAALAPGGDAPQRQAASRSRRSSEWMVAKTGR